MRVLRMLMHLSSCHVTLLRGEFQFRKLFSNRIYDDDNREPNCIDGGGEASLVAVHRTVRLQACIDTVPSVSLGESKHGLTESRLPIVGSRPSNSV